MTFPCTSVLVAKWVPARERATLGAFTFGALAIGMTLGNLLSGVILDLFRNWHYVFYFWGLAGIFTTFWFYFFVYDDPEHHPNLIQSEKEYLLANMPQIRKFPIPWKAMLTDRGILALVIGQCGNDFTLFLITNNMPKYMSDVLHYDVSKNTFVQSFPYVIFWFTSIFVGRLSDYLIKERGWNVLRIRKTLSFFCKIFSSFEQKCSPCHYDFRTNACFHFQPTCFQTFSCCPLDTPVVDNGRCCGCLS